MSETENKKPILVPEITPELLEKNDADQKLWANRFIFQNPSVDEYTRRVITDNLRLLETLLKQRQKLAKGALKDNFLLRIHSLRDETAEWLRTAGDFEKARQIAFTPAAKALFKLYEQAVERADEEWCEHPRWRTDESGNIQQQAFREFDFYSARHGRRVAMERCIACDFRNARVISSDLQKLSDHRARVARVAGDKSKEQLAAELSQQKLTSTNLGGILR